MQLAGDEIFKNTKHKDHDSTGVFSFSEKIMNHKAYKESNVQFA